MPSLFNTSARAMKFTLRGPEAQSRSRNNGKLAITTPHVREPNNTEDASPIPVATSLPPFLERPRRAPSPAPRNAVVPSTELPAIESMGAIAERAASAVVVREIKRRPAVGKTQPTWQSMWEQNDLPEELSITQLTTPQQARDIITESFNHFKAIRASTSEYKVPQQQPLEDVGLSEINIPAQGPASPLQVAVEAPGQHNGSTSSTETTPATIPSPSSSSRQSSESFTTAGSNVDLLLLESHQQSDSQMPHLNLLSPLSRYDLGKELEKRARKHVIMKVFRGESSRSQKRESLRIPAFRATPPPPPAKECASCFEDVPHNRAVSLACQHSYCSECFGHLVQTAMQHENFWPPKCCLQEIPENKLEASLSALQLANYRLKAKEYATPAGERWYCAKPECGKWFSKSKTRAQDATVLCSHCDFQMCLFCRAASHATGERCAQDRGLEATLAAAELEGWRQCYSCHTMVELQSGCRHITCKCRAEFCYTCGAVWRTCRCTEDDQTRRRAELAARRVVAQQEEAEMQAAIEAVAQAERQEREQAEAEEARIREAAERDERERIEREEARLAEEMRQFEEMEAARLEKIAAYFEELRVALAGLHKVQERAIFKRQMQQRTQTQQKLEGVASAEDDLETEVGRYTLGNEEKWRTMMEKHAAQIIETAKRHRGDQDKYFLLFDVTLNEKPIDTVTQAHRLEELAKEQESERVALRGVHDRESSRLMVRLRNAHDERSREQREALQQEKQAATQAVSQLERHVFSDGKWLERLKEERDSMLKEEERRLISSGAEPPSVSTPIIERMPEIQVEPFRSMRSAGRSVRDRSPRAPITINWVEVA
ncbi:hypothetical protein MMC30_000507 [Trapelia coarctata]|nr:hypothetical protein [Trapelia coarctata]